MRTLLDILEIIFTAFFKLLMYATPFIVTFHFLLWLIWMVKDNG